jgi:hypothetical protein
MKLFTCFIALMTGLVLSQGAFAVGTVTVTKSKRQYDGSGKLTRVVKVHWVADASAATVPNTDITGIHGFLMKVVTDPGATAPTDNYDITLVDKADGGSDCLAGSGVDRDTANTEIAYPVGGSRTMPAWCQPDTYTFKIANNAVNSASGDVWLYFVDSL